MDGAEYLYLSPRKQTKKNIYIYLLWLGDGTGELFDSRRILRPSGPAHGWIVFMLPASQLARASRSTVAAHLRSSVRACDRSTAAAAYDQTGPACAGDKQGGPCRNQLKPHEAPPPASEQGAAPGRLPCLSRPASAHPRTPRTGTHRLTEYAARDDATCRQE